jgi:uncharacterized repeat protein (TIGR03803 family)
LVLDVAGNLYGTASGNEGGNNGTVFRLNKTGTLTVLHSFTGGSDGGGPQAGLLRDSAGSLYGTAQSGGVTACFDIINRRYAYCGVVFKVDSTGKETVLHAFTGGDGRSPQAALIKDTAGNLYGTTSAGGSSSGCLTRLGRGCGTVFKRRAS